MTISDSYIISYARQPSADFARKLALDLKARGCQVWLDVLDIRAGDPRRIFLNLVFASGNGKKRVFFPHRTEYMDLSKGHVYALNL
jgi:hypothetical protein